MKGYIRQILLLTIFAIGGGYAVAGLSSAFSQDSKLKDVATAEIKTPPKTIDVPFSPSDAVEINKLRVLIEETNTKMWAMINTYGESGEVLIDTHKNYVGVRKAAPKVEEKKP